MNHSENTVAAKGGKLAVSNLNSGALKPTIGPEVADGLQQKKLIAVLRESEIEEWICPPCPSVLFFPAEEIWPGTRWRVHRDTTC